MSSHDDADAVVDGRTIVCIVCAPMIRQRIENQVEVECRRMN